MGRLPRRRGVRGLAGAGWRSSVVRVGRAVGTCRRIRNAWCRRLARFTRSRGRAHVCRPVGGCWPAYFLERARVRFAGVRRALLANCPSKIRDTLPELLTLKLGSHHPREHGRYLLTHGVLLIRIRGGDRCSCAAQTLSSLRIDLVGRLLSVHESAIEVAGIKQCTDLGQTLLGAAIVDAYRFESAIKPVEEVSRGGAICGRSASEAHAQQPGTRNDCDEAA